MLEAFDHDFERLMIFTSALLHAEHHVTVHLDEAAIAVPCETLVARRGDECLHRFVIEAEIEDRVHHARHRVTSAGANRDE